METGRSQHPSLEHTSARSFLRFLIKRRRSEICLVAKEANSSLNCSRSHSQKPANSLMKRLYGLTTSLNASNKNLPQNASGISSSAARSRKSVRNSRAQMAPIGETRHQNLRVPRL